MNIAFEKYGVLSESIEYKGGQVTTAYYIPSSLDRYEADEPYYQESAINL